MKLQEILSTTQQSSHGLNLSKWKGATQFKSAKVESYPLLANVDGDDYYFCVKDGDDPVSYIKAIKIDGLKKEALIVKRTWVEPKYRNRGFMTAMYNTLHNQGFSIISDSILSPESIAIWKKLHSTGKSIKVINADDGTIRDIKSDDFFKFTSDKEHYILEGSPDGPFGSERNNFVCEELKIYIGQDSP